MLIKHCCHRSCTPGPDRLKGAGRPRYYHYHHCHDEDDHGHDGDDDHDRGGDDDHDGDDDDHHRDCTHTQTVTQSSLKRSSPAAGRAR